MIAASFALAALLHAGLLAYLVRRPRPAFTPETAAFGLIVAGLVYDNALISAGSLLGEGKLLEALSRPRFWMHAVLTPLLIPAAGLVAGGRAKGFGLVRTGAWIAALALAAGGLGWEGLWMELKPVEFEGTIRYTAAHPSVPVGAIAGSAACLLAGLRLAIRARRGWLLAGAVSIFGTAALPAGALGPLPGQFGEWLLCAAAAAELRRKFRPAEGETR